LRMGVKLNEDRWAAEANANYKIETLFRNSVFDLILQVNDSLLERNDNQAKLYYVLEELRNGRFWFGAGKSKGLGRCRVEMDLPFNEPTSPPKANSSINHLKMSWVFNTQNPVLVGWHWGKIDPNIPAFAAIEGRLLIQAMRDIPEGIRSRLEMVIGGPILTPEDWKKKLAQYLPKVIAIWLKQRSTEQIEGLVITEISLKKLSKGKYALSKNILDKLEGLGNQIFKDQQDAENTIKTALGKKANLAKRVLDTLESTKQVATQFSDSAWRDVADNLGFSANLSSKLASVIASEDDAAEILAPECQKILPRLYQQVDHQVKLLQSDAWIDVEISQREEHVQIKNMLSRGEIDERQWRNPERVPEGIRSAPMCGRSFLNPIAVCSTIICATREILKRA